MFFFQRRTILLYYVGVFVMWLSVTLVYPATDSQTSSGADTLNSGYIKCDDLMMGQYPFFVQVIGFFFFCQVLSFKPLKPPRRYTSDSDI